jgi:hypothetical protein
MEADRVAEGTVLAYCKKNKLCSRQAEHLTDMLPAKLAIVVENWSRVLDRIKAS